MTKGIKGYNTKKDKPDIEPDGLQTWERARERSLSKSFQYKPDSIIAEFFKDLYNKAMLDLDQARVITFLDRELIGKSVGEGRPFASFTALGEFYGFYPAEISNIRSGVRKIKSSRIRIMLNKLETLKRKP